MTSPSERIVTARGRRGPRAWLDKARTLGDPPADVLLAQLARTGALASTNAALSSLSDGDVGMDGMPPLARAFLQREGIPAWADRGRILRAQRFAERHAVPIACALFCAALPRAFTGAKGVSVLYATRRMHDDVDRRVNETGQFVFDVLMPGGFESGRAVRSSQKVRLLHAAVRCRVLEARGTATAGGGEIPINQEDLLGTLMCFSVVVLDALARMQISVTAEEEEDFIHLWAVVGSLMGISPPWLPKNAREARKLEAAIVSRQAFATEDGQALAAVLMDGIERHLPARGLSVVAPGLMRYFLGDDTADLLALPEGMHGADVARALARITQLLERVGRGALGGLLPKLGRSVIELTMARKLGGRAPSFVQPLSAIVPPPRRAPRASHTRARKS